MKRFHGIYPALLTPFHGDGSINHKALRELVRLNMDKGVAGFYAGGSTAESFLLESAQRKELLETIMDEVAGRCQVGGFLRTMSGQLQEHVVQGRSTQAEVEHGDARLVEAADRIQQRRRPAADRRHELARVFVDVEGTHRQAGQHLPRDAHLPGRDRHREPFATDLGLQLV